MFGLRSLWALLGYLLSFRLPAAVFLVPWVLSQHDPLLYAHIVEFLEEQSIYLRTVAVAVAVSLYWVAEGWFAHARAHQAQFRARNETDHLLSGTQQEWIKDILERVPNWISYPDYEKVRWLNDAMQTKLWKHLGQVICDKIKAALEDKLSNSMLPIAIKSIKVVEASPGDLSPVFTGVKFLYTAKDDEILLELGMTYSGNPTLVFAVDARAFPSVKIQLNNFHISCPLRIGLTPLLSTYPLIGSLQVCFFGKPKIDFSLSVVQQSLDLMSIPGLSTTLRSFIQESIHDCMIWPNVLEIPLQYNPVIQDQVTGIPKSVSMAELNSKYGLQFQPVSMRVPPEPVGTLSVVLVQALNLPVGPDLLDANPSPFAVLRTAWKKDASLRSTVVSTTTNPTWNEQFELQLYGLHDDLIVDIYDGNTWNNMKVPSVLNPVEYGKAVASAPSNFAHFLMSSSDERKEKKKEERLKELELAELKKMEDTLGHVCIGTATIQLGHLKPHQETKIMTRVMNSYSSTEHGKLAIKLLWKPFDETAKRKPQASSLVSQGKPASSKGTASH
eukprot:221228-Prorocentrum_minimum.AAC.5